MRKLLFLLLMACTGPLAAQCDSSGFRWHFEGEWGTGFYEVLQHPNGDVYGLALNGAVVGGSESDALLLRVRPDGALARVHSYYIPGSGPTYCRTLGIGRSGAVYIGGFVAMGSGWAEGVLGKLDADGNVLWAKRFLSTVRQTSVSGIAEAPNGDVLVSGVIGGNVGHNVIWRFDSAGELLWMQEAGWEGLQALESIQTHDDGSFLCTAFLPMMGAVFDQSMLVHGSADGRILQAEIFSGSEHFVPGTVQRNADGSLLMVGSTRPVGGGSSSSVVTLLGGDGRILWSKEYRLAVGSWGYSAVTDGSSGWFVAVGDFEWMYILHLSPGGELLVARTVLGMGLGQRPSGTRRLLLADDGALYLAGSDALGQDALVALDPCGIYSCGTEEVACTVLDFPLERTSREMPIRVQTSGVEPLVLVGMDITQLLLDRNLLEYVDCTNCRLDVALDSISVCAGETFTLVGQLSDTIAVDHWAWSFGDGQLADTPDSAQHAYAGLGDYSTELVVRYSRHCADTARAQVQVRGPQVPELGEDRILCAGDDAVFRISPLPGSVVTWSTGASGNSISVDTAGTYWLQVDLDGCTASDTVSVDVLPYPELELGADTLLCPGERLLLSTGLAGEPHLWHDGSTDTLFMVTASGTYRVHVGTQCIARDSITVSYAPAFGPVEDRMVCAAAYATISLPEGSTDIQWSHGADTRVVSLLPGVYSYSFTDRTACPHTGSFTVTLDPVADGVVYVPNAFSPNGDGFNELFQVVGADHLGFSLSIFNRWGEEIYSSQDPTAAWDGSYGGRPVPTGNYVYQLRYSDTCNGIRENRELRGQVTLLR